MNSNTLAAYTQHSSNIIVDPTLDQHVISIIPCDRRGGAPVGCLEVITENDKSRAWGNLESDFIEDWYYTCNTQSLHQHSHNHAMI
jgi:hypothetical protein